MGLELELGVRVRVRVRVTTRYGAHSSGLPRLVDWLGSICFLGIRDGQFMSLPFYNYWEML